MALRIAPSGKLDRIHPANGSEFTLDELCAQIGCTYVELISLGSLGPRAFYLWCDEDAKLLAPVPPINPIATNLLWSIGGSRADVVVGVVIIADARESGVVDDEATA